MKEVKVFAPASVGNLAVGYDILGLALNSPGDEVIVREGQTKGLSISKITGDNGRLPKNVLENTASFAALQLLKHFGKEDMPIEMEIHKKMGLGTGLGSSAASSVAGVFGVNAYLGYPLTKEEILKFSVEGEQKADGAYHADNVAPSLFGGIVLIRSNKTLDIVQLPVPKGLYVAMIYPHVKILTSESRAILSDHVGLNDFIGQTGNIAAFISSLYTSDLNLLSRSLDDLVIEPQRAKLIPEFYALKEIALTNQALGFSISGAGPSMFALCKNESIAKNIIEKTEQHLNGKGLKSDCFVSKINTEGAVQLY